jgi:hypothetical protein
MGMNQSYWAALAFAALPALACAQNAEPDRSLESSKLRLQASPYTVHFNPKTEHKNVVLLGLEREYKDGALQGAALFSNSFGQDSAFVYPWGGVYKDIFGVRDLSFKWMAGVIYGYKPPYENKVPLNYKGFSPGFIPALNYQITPRWSAQLNWLGTAGIMFAVNAEID